MQQCRLQVATDPLTGLLNRRTLENRVDELLQRGEAFAIAMGDLDHFKFLNDTHGHEAGDRALRLFARTGTLKEDLLPREVIGLAVPGRPIRSLVAEGRSAGGVRDQTGPAGLTHAIPW
jgi:Diguanylate cyclase, GGDEF domain